MLLSQCLAIGLVVFGTVPSWAQQEIIELWPNGLPADAIPVPAERAQALKRKNSIERIAYVDTPSLSIWPADSANANGTAVIVCPGGGYNILAWQKEGVELAQWFNQLGVTAAVLKYRVPRRNPEKIHWEPLQDVQRGIRLLRQNANRLKVDPQKIGVLGFSAGGHLTVMSGVAFNQQTYPPVDQADQMNCRPNFICPIYAAYLGDGYQDNRATLGPLVRITPETPPTFLAVTWDDKMRGAQSALLFAKLRENKVPAEIHVYARGGHGYGIRDNGKPVSNWHRHLKNWLDDSGWLKKSD